MQDMTDDDAHNYINMRASRSVPLISRLSPPSLNSGGSEEADGSSTDALTPSDEDSSEFYEEGRNSPEDFRSSFGPLSPPPPPTFEQDNIPARQKGLNWVPRKKGGGGQPAPKDGGGGAWNLSATNLLLKAKAILAFVWIALSFVTAAHFRWYDSHGVGDPQSILGGNQPHEHHHGDLTTVDGKKHYRPYTKPLLPPALPVSPLLRGRVTGNHIPLPLPPNKVSVVLMNYSRPRMIRESSLMRTLLAHPNVDEVLLLHSNPKTAFEFVHPKVVNIDAMRQNDEIGLSLRFYFCQTAKNPWVIHVDDDMEFTPPTLSALLLEFARNTHRIVGRFGRNLKPNNSFNGYSSQDAHKKAEVVLTKLMIMERDTCGKFFEYAHVIWDDMVLNNGEGPLWNGEDIFMSLVSNHVYGTPSSSSEERHGWKNSVNYAMDWLDVWSAPDHLKDYDHGKLDISGGMSGLRIWDWHWWQSVLRRNRHYSYRGSLWNTAKSRLMELD